MESMTIALPRRAYALCFTQRSGSNHLARELRRTGCLGAPAEFFDYEAEMFGHVRRFQSENLRHYVTQLAAATATANGVFGTKLHASGWLWLQRSSLRNWLRDLPAILTFRRDIVAQTVSYQIAFRTEAWQSEMPAKGQPQYDFDEMLTALRSLEDNNRFWAAWALQRPAPVIVLAYEDFAPNPGPFVAHIAQALNVDLDPALADRSLQGLSRQATDLNADWAARFRSDLAARGIAVAKPVLKPTYPGAT